MATILDALKSISGYPVCDAVLQNIATKRGLNLAEEATHDIIVSDGYRLATADVMRWVSFAPNISQEGVSFDMLYSDRQEMRKEANSIYGELNDDAYIAEIKTKFGYKGEWL
ncbi:MAG: hypothetical protein LBK94_00790 [Prevotellaceae bacterium]|jgi:hypothetical protein|nr:hypothetical protein [Prevotellaceae bacterium]